MVYAFGASAADGVTPNGSLIQASDGQLYGTTVSGGDESSSGTVFRLNLDGAMTVMHRFSSRYADGFPDGIAPQGPLVQGSDGALYGTTASGGRGVLACQLLHGCGMAYRMDDRRSPLTGPRRRAGSVSGRE